MFASAKVNNWADSRTETTPDFAASRMRTKPLADTNKTKYYCCKLSLRDIFFFIIYLFERMIVSFLNNS